MDLSRIIDMLDPVRLLPGEAARVGMMPENRRGFPVQPDRESWRDAAVLVLLYPLGGSVHFPLMHRPEGSGHHSG
ncbi:MAG: coenzyme A pyrophosphatase, partial [Spirochaetales bacterium]